MMAKTQEALAKRDVKRRQEMESIAATFIDLTKEAIEVQVMEVAAKLLAEENRIMFVEFSIMDPEQREWFEKKMSHYPPT
ncbi:hypothetical protein QYE76_053698 [Lolium multiflorum]|uniref:Uncharacterized protein n=1 Tax=Lolium multiflorum TaxID=4521 RepID=A0AAD8SWU6_LOLMU|nr:hypothetical protein QYE76_053698 [Lolium multiflorum]